MNFRGCYKAIISTSSYSSQEMRNSVQLILKTFKTLNFPDLYKVTIKEGTLEMFAKQTDFD